MFQYSLLLCQPCVADCCFVIHVQLIIADWSAMSSWSLLLGHPGVADNGFFVSHV
jgi:hypothetical protein